MIIPSDAVIRLGLSDMRADRSLRNALSFCFVFISENVKAVEMKWWENLASKFFYYPYASVLAETLTFKFTGIFKNLFPYLLTF